MPSYRRALRSSTGRTSGQYDKREVKVEGQAAFAVVKNEQQPFIVYSDRVKTTVLGTVFEVTAEKDSDNIRVRLLAGKVMVTYDPVADDSARNMCSNPARSLFLAKRMAAWSSGTSESWRIPGATIEQADGQTG
jgi:ferric-dicitrate binding protein FerR (iron transport regulator)